MSLETPVSTQEIKNLFEEHEIPQEVFEAIFQNTRIEVNGAITKPGAFFNEAIAAVVTLSANPKGQQKDMATAIAKALKMRGLPAEEKRKELNLLKDKFNQMVSAFININREAIAAA